MTVIRQDYGATVGKKNMEKGLVVTIRTVQFNGFILVASISPKFQKEDVFVLIAVNKSKESNMHFNLQLLILLVFFFV